jgi:crotonobetainyl-CoA:carnitine CoA-transferase CaiB-like acyl-CoA transferase
MSTFDASDGQVNICASTQYMWAGFCEALDAPALHANADYATFEGRVANRRALDAEVNAVTRRFTVAELVARLNPAGVPCGPVYNIGQAFEDPQVRHLRMTRPARHPVLGDVNLIRSPINLSAFPHPAYFHHAAPDPGEQTDALLEELGYGADDIAAMKLEGAVE